MSVLPWDDLRGPGLIPCEHKCEVPLGVKLLALPETRHAWPGLIHCPYDCGRCFEARCADDAPTP